MFSQQFFFLKRVDSLKLWWPIIIHSHFTFDSIYMDSKAEIEENDDDDDDDKERRNIFIVKKRKTAV